MGDLELEAENRLRRSRRWFVATTLVLVTALVAVGAWVHLQVPSAVALEAAPSSPAIPADTLNARATQLTDQLAAASGRTLDSLAEQVKAPVTNPAESQAPVVSAAQSESDQDSTLAELEDAEEAAAADLAQSKEDAAAAKAEQEEAAKALAEEEAAAARAVDDAIDAAIAAAQSQTGFVPYSDGLDLTLGDTVTSGSETSTEEVLKFVKAAFPADQVGNAMAVARCESGHANRVGKANSNGTRDYGVFQINDGGTLQAALRKIGVEFSDLNQARSKALDAAINVRMARAIWDARGWQPWVCASKLKIVAGLYQRAPGPMAGKYDEYGRAR